MGFYARESVKISKARGVMIKSPNPISKRGRILDPVFPASACLSPSKALMVMTFIVFVSYEQSSRLRLRQRLQQSAIPTMEFAYLWSLFGIKRRSVKGLKVAVGA